MLQESLSSRVVETGKPVIFTNQYPIEGTDAFWTAYAGWTTS